MATCSSFSHRLLCTATHSSSSSPSKCITKFSRNLPRNRYKCLAKSSRRKNTSTVTTTTSTPKLTLVDQSDETEPPRFSFSGSISLLISFLREGFQVDELGSEIWSIALPAVLALAADPIALLVDTAFVGHIGSVELAAIGVSVSVFNLVSKLFNVPLLNVTTSFVAEEQTLINQRNADSGQSVDDYGVEMQGKKIIPSVSTSLALAAGIGIAEAVVLSVGSGFLMNIMGIPVDSPMRVPTEKFLTWRAVGAPPIVIALVAQGSFRGFKDTKTPLYAVGAGNLLNAILDPILIFSLHLGMAGAAVATVISEYLIAFILLWKLSEKVVLISPNIDGKRIVHYLKSGGLLISRTIAVLLTTTLSASLAAREGPVAMAGHQICIQVWLAVSMLTDALALAGQALLATGYTKGNYEQSRQVTFRLLQMGLTTGVSFAGILFLGFGAFSHLFTTDPEVLKVAWSGLFFVAGSQPMNAIAFILDGLYYGVSDFGFAAYSMLLVSAITSVFLLVAAPVFGLAGIWTGLFLFMTLRVAFGLWRLGTKGGPWEAIWSEEQI